MQIAYLKHCLYYSKDGLLGRIAITTIVPTDQRIIDQNVFIHQCILTYLAP